LHFGKKAIRVKVEKLRKNHFLLLSHTASTETVKTA